MEAVTFSAALTWLELAVLKVGSLTLVGATYLLIAVLWLVEAGRLELLKAANAYTLRVSSLEVKHGIVENTVFTVSASGFSDLEVTKTLMGRVLNVGNILVETDSGRDLTLTRIRNPTKVASIIRQVMTVPLVRVAGEAPIAAGESVTT